MKANYLFGFILAAAMTVIGAAAIVAAQELASAFSILDFGFWIEEGRGFFSSLVVYISQVFTLDFLKSLPVSVFLLLALLASLLFGWAVGSAIQYASRDHPRKERAS